MTNLIRLISEGKYGDARKMVFEMMEERKAIISEEYKKWLSSTLIDEGSRYKIVRVRIRRGKIERRKKVSKLKGYTFRGGKLVRMKNSERIKRKLGQRRGKIKRKAKASRARLKYKRSMRRLHNLGGGKKR